jgi:hypothetical protein
MHHLHLMGISSDGERKATFDLFRVRISIACLERAGRQDRLLGDVKGNGHELFPIAD